MSTDTNVIRIREHTGIFHANADGTTGTTSLVVEYDTNEKQFIAFCPRYLDALGIVQGDTEEEVIRHYEQAAERYSLQRLRPSMKEMLAIRWARSDTQMLNTFGLQANVGLGYTPVFESEDGKVYGRGPDGEITSEYYKIAAVLIPDTPDVRAKLDAMIASINVASDILRGLDDAADPTKYLLAITDNVSGVQSEPQPAVVEDDEL